MVHLSQFILPLLDLESLNGLLAVSTKLLAQVILSCDRVNNNGRAWGCEEYQNPASNSVELVLSPGIIALAFEAAKFGAFNWVMWRICMLF